MCLCVQDRLEHLRQQCGPHVAAVAKDSVEGICSKIYQLSADYSRRLRQTHLSLLQDPPAGEAMHAGCSAAVATLCFSHDVCLCACAQRRVRPPSSSSSSSNVWSTVTPSVWPFRPHSCPEWSCTLRTTWPVCASEGRWSRSTEVISASW